MRSSHYNKIKQATSILSAPQDGPHGFGSSMEAAEMSQGPAPNLSSTPQVPELATVETPTRRRSKNGVIDLFSPKSTKRRKNLSNNMPFGEGLSSLNGSMLSHEHPDAASQIRRDNSRNISDAHGAQPHITPPNQNVSSGVSVSNYS